MQRKDFPSSPLGLHRVIKPAGALPQAAWQLDPSPGLWPDEVRVRVDRLNLDAASFRQLTEAANGTAEGRAGDPGHATAMRAAVLGIVAERGKMQNPVTGSGGMLTGVVAEVGPDSPLGLAPGDRIATLVSLSLTPLVITDGLARWDGRSEQVPCDGHAILFGRSIAAVLPGDLPVPLSLAVLSAAAAREAGARSVIGLVPTRAEADLLTASGLADQVVIADARDPAAVAEAVQAAGGPAQVTVVCVDVPGCEGGAVLATADGGTVIFFSMATSFSAAALGAEGVGADITMLIGNGYVPGHAALALDLVRAEPGARQILESRMAEG